MFRTSVDQWTSDFILLNQHNYGIFVANIVLIKKLSVKGPFLESPDN